MVKAKIWRSVKSLALVGCSVLLASAFLDPIKTTNTPSDEYGLSNTSTSPTGTAENNNSFESDEIQLANIETTDSILEDQVNEPIQRQLEVASGDTLVDVLMRGGVSNKEANQAIHSLKDIYDPRSLKAGQKITVAFARPAHGLGIGDLTELSLRLDAAKEVSARRGDDGLFQGGEKIIKLTRRSARYSGVIQGSLFGSAQKIGVPAPVIHGMIRALSYDVDFQRDVHPGTPFEVVFESYHDSSGKFVRHGDMLYASITLGGTAISMYRFETNDGNVAYFDMKGESIKKALLKTPVDGARISSRYGMRRHPILGYSKMHRGIDFAVPSGTPIKAAGDGVIEIARYNGGFGNYIKIRHAGGYATAFAHMKKFAKGMRPGKRVKQGQTIGYVGSTGRSTGPHLHYEVLMGNKHINPLKVRAATSTRLAGRDLERFQQVKKQVKGAYLATAAPNTEPRIASSDDTKRQTTN